MAIVCLAAAGHQLSRAASVPVLNQVDPGDDVDDRPVGRRQHARVAGQEQAIRLVEMDVDVELGQRPGHDVADADRLGIERVVQEAGERHFLDAADGLAVA